ncbi:MAG: exonuclease [Thalassobius sp.]|nr:exonuclease [Thalassovita sp.]
MYAIVDLETTGGLSEVDRITEVAIFIHDGSKIVDEFTSLVNPEREIPPFVARLTNISDEMVAEAPRFFEVAKRIIEMTENCTIVAHNASFDYNFLKHEFKMLGYDYRKNSLCTVQLSRVILPGMRSYSLGKLCKEIGIDLSSRHRAFGDARATVTLFEMLLEKGTRGVFEEYLSLDLYSAKHHPNVSPETIENLKEETGIYYFHDQEGNIIYIGKSKNIRTRVMSHFTGNTTRKAKKLKNAIADISFECTGSELVALLKEESEIKKHQPFFNSALKRGEFRYGIYAYPNKNGYINLIVRDKRAMKVEPVIYVYSKNRGIKMMEQVLEKFKLCQKLCGLYESRDSCFNYMVSLCNGACVGKEEVEVYNRRVEQAIAYLKGKGQNYFIVDKGRHSNERTVVQIENGRYKGFGYLDMEEAYVNATALKQVIIPSNGNKDTLQIITTYLRKKKVEKIIRY